MEYFINNLIQRLIVRIDLECFRSFSVQDYVFYILRKTRYQIKLAPDFKIIFYHWFEFKISAALHFLHAMLKVINSGAKWWVEVWQHIIWSILKYDKNLYMILILSCTNNHDRFLWKLSKSIQTNHAAICCNFLF